MVMAGSHFGNVKFSRKMANAAVYMGRGRGRGPYYTAVIYIVSQIVTNR